MTTIELKDILIQKIIAINDKSFLSAIKTIIDAKSETVIYRTTPDQRQNIAEGVEQIARGEFVTNGQVETEIAKWLKEK